MVELLSPEVFKRHAVVAFEGMVSGGLGTVELMVVLDVLEQQVSNLNDSMILIKGGGHFFTVKK